MSTTGYSDRINHALAFAAKHHDQQVRKGTRLPYLTRPSNVAIILARYDQDEQTIVAGILQDVVEDCVRDAFSLPMLQQRVGDKFGSEVLDTALAVTPRRIDDDGIELSHEDRRDDFVERMSKAGERGRWVCAANELHGANTILADLRRTIDPNIVWGRFTGGKDATVRWHRRVCDRLTDIGFDAPIMVELRAVVTALEEWSETPVSFEA